MEFDGVPGKPYLICVDKGPPGGEVGIRVCRRLTTLLAERAGVVYGHAWKRLVVQSPPIEITICYDG